MTGLRRAGALLAALAVLAAGRAAAGRTLAPAWRAPGPAAGTYRPAPLLPGDSLREAYRVRLNGRAMDLARFASRRPLGEVLAAAPRGIPDDPRRGLEEILAQGDGAGGTSYWRSLAPLLPLEGPPAVEDPAGADPGGLRPPGARRVLSALSDREDGLAAAFYEAGPPGPLAAGLAREGWAGLDLGGGLALWGRGGETLLVEAGGPGRPGTALVYWRAPGGSP